MVLKLENNLQWFYRRVLPISGERMYMLTRIVDGCCENDKEEFENVK